MDAEARKFISISPAITEIVYAIGADANLAANTRHCDFPPKAKAKNRIEVWEQPSAGLAKKYGAELILADRNLPEGVASSCEAAGVEIVAIAPTTLEEVFLGIAGVGKAVGEEAEAAKVVGEMRRQLGEIEAKAGGLRQRPRVYVEESGKPPVSAGYWVPKLVEIAGGASGLIKEGQRPRDVSRKEMFDFNPEVMIVAWRGVGKNAELKAIEDRGWQGLKAMSARHLSVFDDALLLRAGPRLVEGGRQLAGVIAEAAEKPDETDEDEGWAYGEEESAEAGRPSI